MMQLFVANASGEMPPASSLVALESTTVSEGGAKKRVISDDNADLIVFFGGEQHGSMDTCGCLKAPRGGLPRTAKMVNVTKQQNPDVPLLLVNVGGWLNDTIGINGEIRSDIKLANEWMFRGLVAGDWTAANVGFLDLPYLDELREFPPMAVSANIVSLDDAALPLRSIIREFEGLKVGITGVSGQGISFVEPSHYAVADPVELLKAVVETLRPQVDVVIVLGYGLGRRATEIAEISGIDVLIEGDRHHARYPLSQHGSTIWLRSRYETQSLGELRLWLEDRKIVKASERSISLDEQIASDPELKLLLEQAEAGIEGARRALLDPPKAPPLGEEANPR